MNIEITREEFKRLQTFFAVNPGAEKCSINVDTERDEEDCEEEDEPRKAWINPLENMAEYIERISSQSNRQDPGPGYKPKTQEEADRIEAEAFMKEFNKKRI